MGAFVSVALAEIVVQQVHSLQLRVHNLSTASRMRMRRTLTRWRVTFKLNPTQVPVLNGNTRVYLRPLVCRSTGVRRANCDVGTLIGYRETLVQLTAHSSNIRESRSFGIFFTHEGRIP